MWTHNRAIRDRLDFKFPFRLEFQELLAPHPPVQRSSLKYHVQTGCVLRDCVSTRFYGLHIYARMRMRRFLLLQLLEEHSVT